MLIGLSGYAQSGKDTVGNHLVEKHGFARVAFADALKEVAYILNPLVPVVPENPAANATMRLQVLVNEVDWDNAKHNKEVRRILQILGTEAGRNVLGEDIWVEIAKRKINKIYRHVVVTDCRFPNELAFIRENNGSSWWIERKGVQAVNNHISEHAVSERDVDHMLLNNGSIRDLCLLVDELIKVIND